MTQIAVMQILTHNLFDNMFEREFVFSVLFQDNLTINFYGRGNLRETSWKRVGRKAHESARIIRFD